ncbi:MAG: MogA/MoaB family molybdenum cofactor biosynthesis protein [Clostridia bacterium]|mgnify:CR=1 FL=1|nr:MogA/MoaB family molybdenum cofactor biosynthesis protein [Clostridia bacterium]
MNFAVLTVSDRCYKGICEDKSGPLITELLTPYGKIKEYITVPDETEKIKKALIYLCDDIKADVIFTTGGTGFAPRDVTPEATKSVIEREAPGIAEGIRQKSMTITPKAMLSRALSGIRKKSLIINLPGSPKAVKESLEFVLPVIPHAVEVLSGDTLNCGGNYEKVVID